MNVECTRLPSGLTVVTENMPHLESASLGIWVKAGSRSEHASEHGISHVLEHMAFKGTALRDCQRINLDAERLGAQDADALAGHSPDRSRFQQDYDRIVFTSAFRRLKDKTQVFPLAQSDYVRTRLTHSLEASCVGRSLGLMVGRAIVERHGLAPDVHPSDFGSVVAAACLAHDIGNPPFGHAGEDAMRAWFATHPHYLAGLDPDQRADLLNYEGNAQGFRILTHLQTPTNPGGLQ